jgi:LytR cell envelope-related transcriptional attenuator
VLIVAVIALRNPKHPGSTAGSDTRTVTPSASVPSTPSSSPGASTSHRSSPSSTPSSSGVVGSVPLVVLNNTTTPNLARDAARRFEGAGWNVTTFEEDYRNDILSTAAYYDPEVPGAKAAATALQEQFPTIKRVVPKFAGMPAGPVVVVLTTDYVPQ